MLSDNSIHVGKLVTVNDVKYGYSKNIFQDITLVEKGSVGVVIKIEENFLKVLWNIDRQGIVLFIKTSDVILLDNVS